MKCPAVYSITGLFNIDISRHLIAPFDALQNDSVRSVTILKPVRGGGSMVADMWVPWLVANDPGPLMWNMQTDKIAEDHAETRAMPILENCIPTRELFPKDRNKKRKTEVIFSNGMPIYIQGPSIGNLQSKGIRYLINDELWIWKPGRLADAKARTADFEEIQSSTILNVSQAGVEDDDLDVEWGASLQHEWLITCLSCGHKMVAKWSNFRADGSRWGVVWDDDETTRDARGEWVMSRVLESVRFECEKCGHPHSDTPRTRQEWNRLGEYRVMNPGANPRNHGYHWISVIHRNMTKLVEKFLRAKDAFSRGSIEPLKEFFQKEMAESWSEMAAFDPGKQTAAVYDVKSDWPEEKHRFLTIDVQQEGEFYYVLRAWSDKEARRLDYGHLFSFDAIEQKQAEFGVPANHVAIDSGYRTREVYSYCCKNGWTAFKGESVEHFTHSVRRGKLKDFVRRSYSTPAKGDPEAGKRRQGQRFCKLVRWSNPAIKDRLKRLRDGKGVKWQHTQTKESEDELEYERQMRAEYPVIKKDVNGRRSRSWTCPSGNNHFFDCEALQVLMATLFDMLTDNLEDAVNVDSE